MLRRMFKRRPKVETKAKRGGDTPRERKKAAGGPVGPRPRRNVPETPKEVTASRARSTARKERAADLKVATKPAKVSTPRPKAKLKPQSPAQGQPRSIAAAKKAGKDYFYDKNGVKKAAVTAADLKASGHKTLRAYLNAKKK